ncbi:DEAD-domain-containing protein, partial [Nadsonia fulvescens var. elongata DSM 6958]
MSDSEEDYDISKSIGFASGLQADSDSSSSESESGDYDVQDEILSSSEDEEPVTPTVKSKKTKEAKKAESKPTVEAFPSMEIDGDSDNDSDTAAYFTAAPTKKVSVGTFSGLGFSKFLLRNIIKKGFKHPTPIQRKTIPLINSGRDLVGMARTGSGKTAAFVLPMLEKLKIHSAKIGARAIILSPSRELALQTLKVVKDFCKGTDLRTALIVGGDSFDEQFKYMMSNPDIIIATPGRFLHLKVEMKLDLKSMEYVVFDEADRLFEMGFAEQLNEIIASLPPSRQTLLFSATLPKNLVEFAKAGLQDPVLVRLDADTKISENLQMAYFSIKRDERDAGLAYILREIIQIPPASPAQLKYLKESDQNQMESEEEEEDNKGKNSQKKGKSKRYAMRLPPPNELPTEHSTIVFTPTKHHVEYVTSLLNKLGYATSYIYGTLDQRARKDQLYRFRCGYTSILVVTDVAARGIDIPILANVVNYSLPGSSKVFVHRVGRTARAGRKGWAYSLVSENELPYVLDLELFLGRKLLLTADQMKNPNVPVSYTDRMVMGSFPRNRLEMHSEEVTAVIENDYDISCQRDVALKGEKLYLKTRSIASLESIKRSKALLTKDDTINKGAMWDDQHLLFGASAEKAKDELLALFGRHKQQETVFEFGNKSGAGYQLMKRRWKEVNGVKRRAQDKAEIRVKEKETFGDELDDLITNKKDEDDEEVTVEEKAAATAGNATASEADLSSTFEEVTKKKSFRDPNFYMSHYDPNQSQEKGFSLGGDTSFAEGARNATFDISGEGAEFQQKQGMKWDKKK